MLGVGGLLRESRLNWINPWVDQFAAVQLFIGQAQRVEPDFAPDVDELAAIARICQLVAGMPLGIILAATWVKLLTPAEIAAEVGQSLDVLSSQMRNLPARQRSMQTVFDHSWRLLSEDEQAVFRKLSVFRGGFTREAAQAVAEARLPVLMGLVDKSLLYRVPSGRYEIHELLRQYAEAQLETAGEADTAREAHCAYFCDFIQGREGDLKGGRQSEALSEIKADRENVRGAWRWAVERGQIERIDKSIIGLGLFCEWSRFYEANADLQLAADRMRSSPRLLAKILAWQGRLSVRMGRAEEAARHLAQSLALLEEPALADQDIRLERAFTLLNLGHHLAFVQAEAASKYLEESLALCRSGDDQWLTADVLRTLAVINYLAGSRADAKRLAEEGLTIQRALEDYHGVAYTLDILGWIASDQGHFEEGLSIAREALAIRQEFGDQADISKGLYEVGEATVHFGNFIEADDLFERAWLIESSLGRSHHLATLNAVLTENKLYLGQYEHAQIWAQRSLSLAEANGFPFHLGYTLRLMGCLKLAAQAYSEALHLLEEALVIIHKVGSLHRWGRVLTHLGYAHRQLGDAILAQQRLVEALQLGISAAGTVRNLIEAIPLAALLLVDRGEHERAVDLYALTTRYPYVANSRWFEDVAGRHIAAAAETLPPAVVAAAQERGRARELAETARALLAELEAE